MRPSRAEPVFVDTGAWIALALVRDPVHANAVDLWEDLLSAGARLATSIPIIIETFTFLERNATRDVALSWKDGLKAVPFLRALECHGSDLEKAWAYFGRKDLHKLSVVDATSFVLMTRERIRRAFAFDHHFAKVGFALVG